MPRLLHGDGWPGRVYLPSILAFKSAKGLWVAGFISVSVVLP